MNIRRVASKMLTAKMPIVMLFVLMGRMPSMASDPAAATASTPVAAELTEMKALIQEQRRQIERLQATVERQQGQLDRAIGAVAPPTELAGGAIHGEQKAGEVEILKGELEAVAESAAQANQRISKIESDSAAYTKSNDAKVKQLGNFSFSGDVRARYEPFLQEGAVTRQRERIRVRLNLAGKLSDEFSGGIGLATGSLDDPVSTNQTMTGFFNRKNFAIDKAYITYKPKYAKFLRLDAGKFVYPWYRTGLTFDSDVNPEGFAQTMSFDLEHSVLKNITVVGFQLPINESSSGHDSFIFGGQIQTKYRLGSKALLSLYGAGININRADPIAVAIGNGSLKPSLSNSNTFRTNSSGTVIGYATKFAYLDAIMKLELETSSRFPTTLQFNFVNNVRGSSERSGYWADLMFGRNKEIGDMQFGYSFIKIEKDAVIGAWNESDLRSATNVLNHRLNYAYMFKGNFTGQFTAWIGKLNNPAANMSLIPTGIRGSCTASSCEDSYLKRLQFDIIYKF